MLHVRDVVRAAEELPDALDRNQAPGPQHARVQRRLDLSAGLDEPLALVEHRAAQIRELRAPGRDGMTQQGPDALTLRRREGLGAVAPEGALLAALGDRPLDFLAQRIELVLLHLRGTQRVQL